MVAPSSRCRFSAELRNVAMSCGVVPFLTADRSSSKVTSRTWCTQTLDPPKISPLSHLVELGEFEQCQADRVDELAGPFAGRHDQAGPHDTDGLAGVGNPISVGVVSI